MVNKNLFVIGSVLLISLLFFSPVWGQLPVPARIGGAVTINGIQIKQENGSEYSFEVTRENGISYTPKAECKGLNSFDWYEINIPIYDASEQPGGANSNDTAVIHVYHKGKEITVLTPSQGKFTVGEEGSILQMDLSLQGELPTANAGPDQTATSGVTVTLDGSASSTNPQGGTLTYRWEQTSGTAVSLSGSSVAKPTFSAPAAGAGQTLLLEFKLTVTDTNNTLSSSDTVKVSVVGPPIILAPTADAGSDQTVASATVVTLNGFGSTTNPQGGTLSYSWEQTSGTKVSLSGATTAKPTFTAPTAGQGQTLTLEFTLTVTDTANKLSNSDKVTVRVTGETVPPTAYAGPDQSVSSGIQVTLDGSGSATNPSGGTLAYRWEQTSGTTVSLSGTTIAKPTFTAPAVGSGLTLTLEFKLTVTDTNALSSFDTVMISVKHPPNNAPVAKAGEDQSKVKAGTTVTLDGTGSYDPDPGDSITYYWRQSGGPSVTLSNDTVSKPTFVAPNPVAKDPISLTFELTVQDKNGLENRDPVIITVLPDFPPIANAGPDQDVIEGSDVVLDGSNSTDQNNSQSDGIVSYQWRQLSGITVNLRNADQVRAGFKAPDVPSSGESLLFELTVTDKDGLKDTAETRINILSSPKPDPDPVQNKPPVANPGPDRTVKTGSVIILDGSGSSDPNGADNIAAYLWVQTQGKAVTLSNADSVRAVFTCPSTEGVLVFELTVTDKGGLKNSKTVFINVTGGDPPVADAGIDQRIKEREDVHLDGSRSKKGDNPIAMIIWSQIGGIPVTLSDPKSVSPVFKAPDVNRLGEDLSFELTVIDSNGLSSRDTVRISVIYVPIPPKANAGSDRTAGAGERISLDGSDSTDSDGMIVSYLWSQIGGTPVVLTDSEISEPSFVAPTPKNGSENLSFRLTVVDDEGLQDSDYVVITINVSSDIKSPFANAGPDKNVDEGSSLTLDGSASFDPDGVIISYRWSQAAGPTVLSPEGGSTPKFKFTVPPVETDTELFFNLTVTDNVGLISTDQVRVYVKNLGPGPGETNSSCFIDSIFQ